LSDFLLIPAARGVRGTLRAPSSKSATNRALLLAAFSPAEVEIVRPLASEDTEALCRCLAAMGAAIEPSRKGLLVRGPLSGRREMEVLLNVKDSGTAARFLAAAASVTPGRFLLTGSARLRERPIGELVAALRSAGAEILYSEREGCLPLKIRGGTLRSGSLAVDASRSSQFLSALLLAAVAVEGGLEVRPSGPIVSSPYVEVTLEALAAFGHEVAAGGTFRVARGSSPVSRYETPGDYSSALPLLAAAGVAGGEVTVTGLRYPSRDADALALPVLERMGLRIEARPSAVTARAERAAARPVTASASEFPDAVPTLAALALFASGTSRFYGIRHLRWKESDRIEALAALLRAAGGSAAAGEDELIVGGPPRSGAEIRCLPTASDHRIAMAAGLISLGVPALSIENPGCVGKSYPGFFHDLESLIWR